jgi:hypothetical protein
MNIRLILIFFIALNIHSNMKGICAPWEKCFYTETIPGAAKEVYHKAVEPVYEKAILPVYEKALLPVYEKAMKPVYDQVVKAGLTVSKAVADRFKDTKVTRAIDFHIQLAALETYLQLLKASKATAIASLEAAKQSAKASLNLAQGFLDKVVKNAALGALEGPAQAAKGILTAAQATSVGALEAGKFVVDKTVGQFDITCIHYHGDVKSIAKLNLGNVKIHAKIFKPFTIDTNLDLAHPLDSAQHIALAIADKMKEIILEPFNALKKTAPQIDKKAEQVNQLQVPKDVQQKAQEAQQNMEKLPKNFEQLQQEVAATAQAVKAKPIEQDIKATYEELLKKIKALPQNDPKRKDLEAELERLTKKS